MSDQRQSALRVGIAFDLNFVLNWQDTSVFPMDVFVDCLKAKHSAIEVADTGLNECVLYARGELARLNWETVVNEVLREISFNVAVQVETRPLDEAAAPQEGQGTTQAAAQQEDAGDDAPKPVAPNSVQHSPLEADDLVGAEAFKALLAEIGRMAPRLIETKTQHVLTTQAYLFSVGDGCGLSTALTMLRDQLAFDELYDFDVQPNILEHKQSLPEDDDDKFGGGWFTDNLICMDISDCLHMLHKSEFRQFLKKLESSNKTSILAFRIPFVDESTLHEVSQALSDVFFVREVPIPPVDMQGLRQFALRRLQTYGMTMEDDAWQTFDQMIINEKNDGRFYGFKTVEKVLREIIYAKHRTNSLSNEAHDMFAIVAEEVRHLVREQPEGDAMAELDGMIGMESVKEQLLSILSQMEYAKADGNVTQPCMHMRFTGAPGTGKTTVARVLGRLAKERGILSNGAFFEYMGRDLCGRYVGQTAPKTAAICRDAFGSVLFIDEAYSLSTSRDDDQDYGREAITTLVAQMENHRKEFIVIMAGYEDDMDLMVSSNAGLSSRMPYTIHFPNYGREDLFAIFMSMVEKKFAYEEGFKAEAKAYFDALPDEELEDKTFANARFVRNLYERTWGKAAVRRQIEPDAPFVLMALDFAKAISEKEFAFLQKSTKQVIGFVSDAE